MEAARTFDIGRVITRTLTTIRDNPGPFVMLGVVLGVLPLIPYMFLSYENLAGADFGQLGLIGGIFAFFAGLCPMIMGIACIQMTAQAVDDGQVDVGVALKRGLTALIPMIVHTLLWVLGFYAGLILILIPGIIIACMWAVSFPALVIERKGIIGSFGRSRALTKGSRWKVFALYVLIFLFSIVLTAMTAFLGPGLTDILVAPSQINISTTFKIVSPIISAISYVLYGVFFGAMFIELRDAAEGPKTEKLRDVFA